VFLSNQYSGLNRMRCGTSLLERIFDEIVNAGTFGMKSQLIPHISGR